MVSIGWGRRPGLIFAPSGGWFRSIQEVRHGTMKCGKAIPPGSRAHFGLLKESDGQFCLVLTGQLGADTVPKLSKELEQELAATPMTLLEIDASGLTHCDSAGLGLLYFLSTGRMTPGAKVT